MTGCFALPLLAGGGWEGVTFLIFCAKSDPTPTLPCEQGREHDARTVALLLPLLAGGGWEGVTLLIFCAKSEPTPSCKHDRRMDRFKTVRTTKDFKIALRARR